MEIIEKDQVNLFYWQNPNVINFGDELSKVVVGWITGKKVVRAEIYTPNKLLAIGSIINWANDGDFIWGAGKHPFIEDSFMRMPSGKQIRRKKPRQLNISMLRGPITGKYLEDLGLEFPEFYGDPASLMPEIYNPKIKKINEVGIIPHFSEADEFLQKGIEIIDVRKQWKRVIESMLGCKKVISSSLHGLIVAEAYGIPAVWLKAKKEGQEKYHDYYLGTNREVTVVDSLKEALNATPPNIPRINYKKIINSFPKEIGSIRK